MSSDTCSAIGCDAVSHALDLSWGRIRLRLRSDGNRADSICGDAERDKTSVWPKIRPILESPRKEAIALTPLKGSIIS